MLQLWVKFKTHILVVLLIFFILIISLEVIFLFKLQKRIEPSPSPHELKETNVISPSIYPFSKSIKVISEVKNFSLRLKNKKELIAYIQDFGLFKKDGVLLIGQTKPQSVNSILIHFSGDPQTVAFDEIVNPKIGRFAGSSAWVKNGVLHLRVFLLPSLYEQKGKDKFSHYLSIGVVRGLFLSSAKSRQMTPVGRREKLEELSRKIGQTKLILVQKIN